MKIIFFSICDYEKSFFEQANKTQQHELKFYTEHLNSKTASIAEGATCVCCFVNDHLDTDVLEKLKSHGTKIIALRSAGYNHVDLKAAQKLGLIVVRVPEYSPYAVAEHAVGLILTLNRKIHRAYNRVREHDFSLHGLMGFDLHGKTVGIIGTGTIGRVFANIMHGFGMNVVAYDIKPDQTLEKKGIKYLSLDELFQQSDIISLHCPLTPETHHLINHETISIMKDSVMLINTSRGAVIDAKALIENLKNKKIGHLGMDVYEEEGDLFFSDLSDEVIEDDILARLLTFPNVIITGHQAFFTAEALENIAKTTLQNVSDFEMGAKLHNQITAQLASL